MPIRAGNLDRRIGLQRQVPNRNTHGELVDGWNTVLTVWASFKPLPAGEVQTDDMTATVERAVFGVRYIDPSLSTAWRISYGGRFWNITDVAEVGRREGFDLTAEVIS